nr:hypothetical protein [Saccharopolyspora pogona]
MSSPQPSSGPTRDNFEQARRWSAEHVRGHLPDDGLRERAVRGGSTDQHRRPNAGDDLAEPDTTTIAPPPGHLRGRA